MAATALNYLGFAAVAMAPYAIRIFNQGAGGVVMASRALLGQLYVLGMIELKRFIQRSLMVERECIGNRQCLSQSWSHGQQQGNNDSGNL
jgi:hypothetical protein